MRRDKIERHVYLVRATWDRLPLLTPQIAWRVQRNVESEAQQQGCTVLAIGGVADHLHVLITLPTTISIALLVKQIKGVSSQFVNATTQPARLFKWQGSYGAFSVSRWDVPRITSYIEHQKEHHANNDLIDDFEEVFTQDHE